MEKWILIFTGGGLGALSRYGIAAWVKELLPAFFPYGTLVANLLGCLLIGIAFAFTELYPSANTRWPLFLMTGFLGSLTTFSTFELEVMHSIRNGQLVTSLIYIGTSVLVGLAAVFAGYTLSTSAVQHLGK